MLSHFLHYEAFPRNRTTCWFTRAVHSYYVLPSQVRLMIYVSFNLCFTLVRPYITSRELNYRELRHGALYVALLTFRSGGERYCKRGKRFIFFKLKEISIIGQLSSLLFVWAKLHAGWWGGGILRYDFGPSCRIQVGGRRSVSWAKGRVGLFAFEPTLQNTQPPVKLITFGGTVRTSISSDWG